jgi:hypothetical protein
MRRRLGTLLLVTSLIVGGLATGSGTAHAAGIVTHAWMGLDAIANVKQADLRAILDAHRDQVRAGAEFPDGGYWTRSLGIPGGDYGEEAHWQRFIDAYAAQIRDDPKCQPLAAPDGPCAATIAQLMGAAAHGMGDEVWDWLFEPNGPGFGEQYLPPAFAGLAGPGGLELQLDIVAIARHGRPTEPTSAIPDPDKITAAFRAIGRTDIDPAAYPQGEAGLEIERSVETLFAPDHIDALERAMPWTSTHMTSSAGGVDWAARAIAGYFDALWGDLTGRPRPTTVSATAPRAGEVGVPATGWVGSYSPGSNDGNHGGLTRIAAALTRALPFHAQAGQGSVPSELPAGSLRVRDLRTGQLVPAAAGYPRIVPYNPEAGEHVVAFQPAGDLAPCRWYQAETTRTLVDSRGAPVLPASWRFRTSGCRPAIPVPRRGTTVCRASGTTTPTSWVQVSTQLELTGCAGGQDGGWRWGGHLPVVAGRAELRVDLRAASCGEQVTPTGPATVSGKIRWTDGQGRVVGTSLIAPQPYDPRGATVVVDRRSRVFPGHSLAIRAGVGAATCAAGTVPFPVTGGAVTAWPT